MERFSIVGEGLRKKRLVRENTIKEDMKVNMMGRLTILRGGESGGEKKETAMKKPREIEGGRRT